MLDEFNVLMIGNNPLELSKVFDHLKMISGKKVITEIAFDLKSGLERLTNFSPNYIIIDDNVGRVELAHVVGYFSRIKKTKKIPITVLKNSNYLETFGGAMNYVLKESLNGEVLYSALKNSLMSSRAQKYLQKVYGQRKKKLLRFLTPS